MKIEGENKDLLNHVLNESRITQFEIDEALCKVFVVFETICIDEKGNNPDDTRVIFHFINVSKVSALVRLGLWDDDNAETLLLNATELSNQIENFNGDSMYGWEFINVPKFESDYEKWKDKASLNLSLFNPKNNQNVIDIFSENCSENPKTLDLRIWFEDFTIENINGAPLSQKEFIERGVRGWNAIYGGDDEMIKKTGIVPLKDESAQNNENKIKPKLPVLTRLYNFWIGKN